jgi:hypothetical protein
MRIADCGMVVTEPQSAIPRSAFRNPRFEIREGLLVSSFPKLATLPNPDV